MIRNETFGPTGQLLLAEVIDLAAGTIAFEENGVIKSTRPLTADEVARYTPPVPVKSPDEKLAEARTVLEQIASLPAPVLTADVVDLLDDLRSVL
jgi:hypothetical protein